MKEYPLQYASTDKNKKSHYNINFGTSYKFNEVEIGNVHFWTLYKICKILYQSHT